MTLVASAWGCGSMSCPLPSSKLPGDNSNRSAHQGHVCPVHLDCPCCLQTRAFSLFSNFLVPDWAPGPVQMRRDRRDIAGRALKAGFGRIFVEKRYYSSKFGSPSVTYPFFGPLIHEYLSMNASTRFVIFLPYKVLNPDFCLPIIPKS